MTSFPGTGASVAPADSSALRAAGRLGLFAGAGAAVLLLSVGVVAGVVPDGAVPFAVLGATLAILGALAAQVWHVRLARSGVAAGPGPQGPGAPDPRLLAAQLQAWLAAGFGVKFALLAGVGLLLHLLGVKFTGIGAFAVAFAVAALLCQVAAALSLSRALTSNAGSPASRSRS